MGIFKKKTPQVVRRSTAGESTEVRTVNGQQVTVRRSVKAQAQTTTKKKRKPQQRQQQKRRDSGRGGSRGTSTRRRPPIEMVEPPETARKQMLVRKSPHQTQIVVLEGPVLVEHYVASTDRMSLVGNVYVGKVRNVLPGMEAAFIDFGRRARTVSSIRATSTTRISTSTGKPKRIENALKPGRPGSRSGGQGRDGAQGCSAHEPDQPRRQVPRTRTE